MIDRGKLGNYLAQPARRQQEWIAAGQDDFPDLRCSANVVERRCERRTGKSSPAGPDHFTTKTETAIDRASVDEFQENAIRIAMHDARHGAVRLVPDRIRVLLRIRVEF